MAAEEFNESDNQIEVEQDGVDENVLDTHDAAFMANDIDYGHCSGL